MRHRCKSILDMSCVRYRYDTTNKMSILSNLSLKLTTSRLNKAYKVVRCNTTMVQYTWWIELYYYRVCSGEFIWQVLEDEIHQVEPFFYLNCVCLFSNFRFNFLTKWEHPSERISKKKNVKFNLEDEKLKWSIKIFM